MPEIDLIRWELWWMLPPAFHVVHRSRCECSRCQADDAEDIAILAWETWVEVTRRRGGG